MPGNKCLCLSVAVLASVSAASAVPKGPEAWEPLRQGLGAWRALDLDADFAVNVGTKQGRHFLYSTDDFTMHTEVRGASLSKWPAAVMILGLVNDGTLKLEDKANKYLDWWSHDPNDPRSEVTLESLLSFTSGYQEDVMQINVCLFGDYLECAKEAYKASTKFTAPRTEFKYLSCHLQFAGAMAVAASGLTIQQLFHKYLYEPFQMNQTSWSPYRYPSMAGGIQTVGADFENFLYGMLTYDGISKETLVAAETDWTIAPVDPSGDGWFGHYAFGHWWECIGYGVPSERDELFADCNASHIQAGPGEFGYYPLIDRSGGGGAAGPERPAHYFQVVLQEPDPLSGVPEYLRILAKPMSDLILSGQDPTKVSKAEILNAGGGIIRRDIVYMQSELGSCNCSQAENDLGEPWNSMLEGLPKDEPHVNRRKILADGDGHTLLDIVKIHAKVGSCKCEGRQ